MFQYKTQEELEKMSAEELKQYHADMKKHEAAERQKEIEAAINPVNKAVEDAKKALADNTKDIKAIKDAVTSIEEKQKVTSDGWENVSKTVENWITEKHDEIKSAYKSNGKIPLDEEVLKAVGLVTTANGTLPTALPANFVAQTQGVQNIKLRRPYLLDYVNTYETNQKSLAYVEAIAGEGDFAVVAEGAAKPQLDIDWVTRYAEPKKYAGYIKVTEEAIEDIPRLRDLIVNYLKDKHDLFKEKEVFTAINTAATTFVTGQSLSGLVAMPTIMDVVNAMQLQIVNTPNYTDEPDFFGDIVLLNVVDFYKYFGAAKDAFGRPLFESGYHGGRTFTYNGFTFVATSLVTAGNILLIDSKKVDVTTYSNYRVEIGWVNDDFIKNQFVILGESRGHIIIKNHDKRAFVKGTIATIIADIEVAKAPAG